MSDYDYRPSHQRGTGAMDYSGSGSGGGIWTVIGLVAILAFIGLILFGAANGGGDTTAPTAPAPAVGDTGQ